MLVTARTQPAARYDTHEVFYEVQPPRRESRRRKPLYRDRHLANAQHHPRPQPRELSPSISFGISGISITSSHHDENGDDFWSTVSKGTGDHHIAKFASHGTDFFLNNMMHDAEHRGRGRSRKRREERKLQYEELQENMESDSDVDFKTQHINNNHYRHHHHSSTTPKSTNTRYTKTEYSRPSPPSQNSCFSRNPSPLSIPRSHTHPRANYDEFLSYAGKETELPPTQQLVIDHWIKYISIVEERILEIAQNIYPHDILSCKIVPDGPKYCVAGLWRGKEEEEVFCATDLESAVLTSECWVNPRDAMWELKGRVERLVEEGRGRRRTW
ncbi:hypothetical protein B0J11DRAFT_242132 [Dendryphion nanum]|uniref:Uncharacterized protein n=1 Tax=Dendryphion nanum TaxID=256645 RepID=A0A9P9CXJ4_9PLEO|nr:hypothetical protein B0J11DRAFT_242132 [Dendryphion nanum]